MTNGMKANEKVEQRVATGLETVCDCVEDQKWRERKV